MKINGIVEYNKYHNSFKLVDMSRKETIRLFENHSLRAILSLGSLEKILGELKKVDCNSKEYKSVEVLIKKLKNYGSK